MSCLSLRTMMWFAYWSLCRRQGEKESLLVIVCLNIQCLVHIHHFTHAPHHTWTHHHTYTITHAPITHAPIITHVPLHIHTCSRTVLCHTLVNVFYRNDIYSKIQVQWESLSNEKNSRMINCQMHLFSI